MKRIHAFPHKRTTSLGHRSFQSCSEGRPFTEAMPKGITSALKDKSVSTNSIRYFHSFLQTVTFKVSTSSPPASLPLLTRSASLLSLPLKVRRAWFLPNKHFYFFKRSGTQRFAQRTAGHRVGSLYPVPLSPDRPTIGTAWLVAVGTSGTETHPATSRPEFSNGRAVIIVCRGLAGRPAGSEYRPSGPPASRHALTNIVWQATLSYCAEKGMTLFLFRPVPS